jgi:hypothetical protein
MGGDKEKPEKERPAGWTKETHGKSAEPNRALVFPSDKVNKLTLSFKPEDWAAMQADLKDLYAPADKLAAEIAAIQKLPKEEQQKAMEARMKDKSAEDKIMSAAAKRKPNWFPATVTFGETTWNHVGVR